MENLPHQTLTKWGLTSLIKTSQDENIDQQDVLILKDKIIEPKKEPKENFVSCLAVLKVPSSSRKACENKQTVTKRKLDQQSDTDPPAKTKREDGSLMCQLQQVMEEVRVKLNAHTNCKLSDFLRHYTRDLPVDRKEVIGILGRTGAGKSFLINAIIGEKDLLPTGGLAACTSVMTRVESSQNKYEAEIEFIPVEEWQDELWSVKNLFGDIQHDDEEYHDHTEKLTALYGVEWNVKTVEELMDIKYFKEIPEFLLCRNKLVQVNSAQELSVKLIKYTRSDLHDESNQRWFWPLIKCVTVRVPDNDFLQHVTLVDLPGNGDRNKSRDHMWKQVVASCSTVWIVSEMNRASSDRDAWEILQSRCDLMGNGGECQNIYFICTKSDHVDGDCAKDICLNISRNNLKAKNLMRKEFNKLDKVKKQFTDECFHVFTVSSKEFVKPKYLDPEETEIPKLQKLLQTLNEQHDPTQNYLSSVYGVLSLIQAANSTHLNSTEEVCQKLKSKLKHKLRKIERSMRDATEEFTKRLHKGVKKSTNLCEGALREALYPKSGGRGFQQQLYCALKNRGIYTTRKKHINLNKILSHYLTDSIDEQFRMNFPNDAENGPVYGAMQKFSLISTRTFQQFRQFELQLIFLKSEEAKVKRALCEMIRQRKKFIYSILTESVMMIMQECYIEAACITGPGSLGKMRTTVEKYLHDEKDFMFDVAKNTMLDKQKKLMEDVVRKLKQTLQEAIELSFRTDGRSLPDCESEFSFVKKLRCDEESE